MPATLKGVQLDHISHSGIRLFQTCPLRFYFRYVEGLPEETISATLLLGSALHASVEFHFRQLLMGCPAPDLDVLLAAFWQTWRSREVETIFYPKGEDLDTVGHLAERMLRAFQASAFAHPKGTILAVEEEVRGPLLPGLPELLARVDLLVETKDVLLLSDFKTARTQWSRDQVLDSADQLLLYSELVKDFADGKPLRLEFAVLTKGKFPELTIHPVPAEAKHLDRTKRVAQRVWQAIQGGNFYPNPSPMNCPTCPFQSPCRAWRG